MTRQWLALLITAVLLSLLVVYLHAQQLGLYYLQSAHQIERHNAIMQGVAGSPWQYRILPEWLVEVVLRWLGRLPYGIARTFLVIRFGQHIAIFLLAYGYYRRLGLSDRQSLIGLNILAWSMTYAYYDSDFQLSTQFDIVFYLLAARTILAGRYGWIIPITALAALNRETSGLIPLMLIAAWPSGDRRRIGLIAAVSMSMYTDVFFGLRYIYAPQAPILPYGHSLGLDLLAYNASRLVTWIQLLATFGVMPIVALSNYWRWPGNLKVWFWLITPVWLVVHWLGGVVAETRLFLVPFAVVILPGAFMSVEQR